MNNYFKQMIPVKPMASAGWEANASEYVSHMQITLNYMSRDGYYLCAIPAKVENGLVSLIITQMKSIPVIRCGRQSQRRYDDAVVYFDMNRERILAKFSEMLGLELA